MSRKNRVQTLKIERVDYPNIGVAKKGERTIHMKGGIPGQTWTMLLGRKKGGAILAKPLELIEASPLETNEPCPAFGRCGGCAYQSLPYEVELELKRDQIARLFQKRGFDVDPVIHPSPLMDGYRNKMEYTFGDEVKDGPLTLGLHAKGHYHDIVDITGCRIVHEDFEVVRQAVQNYFIELGTPFYKRRDHKGLLRHLVVRRSFRRNELMVNLVVTSQEKVDTEAFVAMLLSLPTEGTIRTILLTTNDALADAVIPEKVDILHGDGLIEEEMNGLTFRISPFSFFQPNVIGAEKLYQAAIDIAEKLKPKKAMDLFSGTGTISQLLAKTAEQVTAIEIVEEAVDQAKANAELNGIKNVTFHCGDVFEVLETLDEKPDLILTDPPREGIMPKALDKIIELGPDNMIYISCNPKTMVGDIEVLEKAGYALKDLHVFDQFSRTVHVEAVVLLRREKIDGYVDIDLDVDQVDKKSKGGTATYKEIKVYIMEKYGLKVSSLNIAQIKDKFGIEKERSSTSDKNNSNVHQCTLKREKLIIEAFEHFCLI